MPKEDDSQRHLRHEKKAFRAGESLQISESELTQALLGLSKEANPLAFSQALQELIARPYPKKFDFQKRTYKRIAKALRDNIPKSLVVLPTGSGKSHMQAELAAQVATLGGRAIIVTSRRTLVEDIASRASQALIEETGFEESPVTAFVRGRKRFDKPVVVMAYPSFAKAAKEGALDLQNVSFVSLDEVHNATTPLQLAAQEVITEAKIPIIAWTATPDTSTGSVENYDFDNIYERSIEDAVLAETISPIKVMHVQLSKKVADLSTVPRTIENDFSPSELVRKVNTDYINHAVVQIFELYCQGHPTLVFTVSRKHAEDIAEAINSKFPDVARFVHSGITTDEQDTIEKLLIDPNSNVTAVANAKLWGEGKDIKQIKRVIMAYPTLSLARLIQCVGRGFRPYQGQTLQVFELHFEDTPSCSMVDALMGRSEVFPARTDNELTHDTESSYLVEPQEIVEGVKIVVDVQEMVSLGSVEEGRLSELLSTDFVLTKKLTEHTFKGGREKIRDSVKKVVKDMVLSGEGRVEYRIKGDAQGKRVVRVINNRELFIKLMVEEGLELKTFDREIVTSYVIDETDFVASMEEIRKIFLDRKNLSAIRRAVIEQLADEFPDLIVRTLRGGYEVVIFKDKGLFLKTMADNGAKLRPQYGGEQKRTYRGQVEGNVESSGLIPITWDWLDQTFVGDGSRLKLIAYEVIAKMAEDDPESAALFTQDEKRFMSVKDLQSFIALMREKGVLLQSEVLELSSSDFATTRKSFRSVFTGDPDMYKNAIAIVNDWRSNFPERLSIRRKTNHYVSIINSEYVPILIDEMLRRGFRLNKKWKKSNNVD